MPSTLEYIIPELWSNIAASLETIDLASLARTSSELNRSIHPILWSNVCISILPVVPPLVPREMDLAHIVDPESNNISEHPGASGADDQDGVDDDNPGMRALKLLASSSSRFSPHVLHIRIAWKSPYSAGLYLPSAPPSFSITRLIHKAILGMENLKSLDVVGGICSDGAHARELTNQLNEREGSARLRKLTYRECWFIAPLSDGNLALAHLTELDWNFFADCMSSFLQCRESSDLNWAHQSGPGRNAKDLTWIYLTIWSARFTTSSQRLAQRLKI
jgi:hypothetical protein